MAEEINENEKIITMFRNDLRYIVDTKLPIENRMAKMQNYTTRKNDLVTIKDKLIKIDINIGNMTNKMKIFMKVQKELKEKKYVMETLRLLEVKIDKEKKEKHRYYDKVLHNRSKNVEEGTKILLAHIMPIDGKGWKLIWSLNEMRYKLSRARGEKWMKRIYRKSLVDWEDSIAQEEEGRIYAICNLRNRKLYILSGD